MQCDNNSIGNKSREGNNSDTVERKCTPGNEAIKRALASLGKPVARAGDKPVAAEAEILVDAEVIGRSDRPSWDAIRKHIRHGTHDDVGAALRFIRCYKNQVCYVPTQKQWYVWNGKYWEPDPGHLIFQKAVELTGNMLQLARAEKDKNLQKLATRYRNVRRLAAIIKVVSTDKEVIVDPREFDAHPHLINLNNGVLDLKNLQLGNHDPALKQTRIALVDYDPTATCPKIQAWLKKFVKHDEDEHGLYLPCLIRILGYAITGETGEQVFFLMKGTSGTGKSTILLLVQRVLGEQYFAETPIETWMTSRAGKAIRDDLAKLPGKRIVVSSECDYVSALNRPLIKQATGGMSIHASKKFVNEWSFTPRMKLFFDTNQVPKIEGTDDAIYRRLVVLPFNQTIEVRIRDFDKKLLEGEREGFFNLLAQGAHEWYQTGLQIPEFLEDEKNAIKNDFNHYKQFIEAKCVEEKGTRFLPRRLYDAFRKWASEEKLRECDHINLATFKTEFPFTCSRPWIKTKDEAITLGLTWAGKKFREYVFEGVRLATPEDTRSTHFADLIGNHCDENEMF